MKKLLAILLALMLVLVNVAALAAGEDTDSENPDGNDEQLLTEDPNLEDMTLGALRATGATIDVSSLSAPTVEQTITIQKNYTVTATDNWYLPADVLTFTPVSAIVEDGPANTAPAVTITADAITGGPQGDTNTKLSYDVKIKLPVYTAVGVYYYTFTESDNQVAGVTYIPNTLSLRVTVVNDYANSALKIEAVALRQNDSTADTGISSTNPLTYDLSTKIDSLENGYAAGSLTVTKTVTGNLGDLNKEWEFTVTLTSAKVVKAPITYKQRSTDASTKEIKVTDWTGGENGNPYTTNVKVYLKSGQTVQFDNIPDGVIYSVTETEAASIDGKQKNSDGYTTVAKGNSDTIVGAQKAAAVFTNDKTIPIDTGVTLETLPYVLLMALTVIGMAVLFVRKREEY